MKISRPFRFVPSMDILESCSYNVFFLGVISTLKAKVPLYSLIGKSMNEIVTKYMQVHNIILNS